MSVLAAVAAISGSKLWMKGHELYGKDLGWISFEIPFF